MRIEILSSTWLQGELAKVGDVIETSSENAKTLVIMGKAKEAVEVCSMKVEKKTTPKRKKPSTPIQKESEE